MRFLYIFCEAAKHIYKNMWAGRTVIAKGAILVFAIIALITSFRLYQFVMDSGLFGISAGIAIGCVPLIEWFIVFPCIIYILDYKKVILDAPKL